MNFLRFFLVDFEGDRTRKIFYIIACFVSILTMLNAISGAISFFLDYFHEAPIFHSLPNNGHLLLYASCLVGALIVALPPTIISVMATLGVQHEQSNLIVRLSGLSSYGSFENQECITRILLLSTLSAAFIILFNTLSVGALYLGAVSLFHEHWLDQTDSIHNLHRHYQCCGLESYADWLKIAARRMPASCNATLATDPEAKARHILVSLVLQSNESDSVKVFNDGCTTSLTGEQAIISGVGNMLAFAGVLLLIAAWSRVERVDEVSAWELKSTVFNQPRHVGEEDDDTAFLAQRHKRMIGRYSVLSSPSQAPPLGAPRNSDTSSDALRLHETRLFMSEGTLRLDDDQQRNSWRSGHGSLSSSSSGWWADQHGVGKLPPRHKNRGNSSKNSNSNSNNSALDVMGQWVGAHVVNSIDRQLQLKHAWEFVRSLRKFSHHESVSLVNELSSSVKQPLNAGSLLESQRLGASSNVPNRSKRVLVRFASPQSPLLLEEILSDPRYWQPQLEPFRTVTSGQFLIDRVRNQRYNVPY